jgi:putative ABC transport system permease protein
MSSRAERGRALSAAGTRLRTGRLNLADLARLGLSGLRTRPLRVFLSAFGIAIGIAAMLAVVGVTTSSRAQLDRTLESLGTNLLTVVPGEQTTTGQQAVLPEESIGMIGRIGPVEAVSATGKVTASVYRNNHVPTPETSSVEVLAAEFTLPGTVGATVGSGTWLTPATATYPAVVLGEWFVLVGILAPVPLATNLDSAALVGWTAARTFLHFDGHPTTIYVRAAERQIDAVRTVLGRTANPQAPRQVRISRPSDALAAKRATDATLNGTLIGLGAVALLVGGVGIANTMVISVLERRAEIGLRRALGATRGHIRAQFLVEAVLLSTLGGAGGTLLGILVTGLYAHTQHWLLVVPAWATGGGLGAAVFIGAIAGLYPAIRASRLAPTAALAGS